MPPESDFPDADLLADSESTQDLTSTLTSGHGSQRNMINASGPSTLASTRPNIAAYGGARLKDRCQGNVRPTLSEECPAPPDLPSTTSSGSNLDNLVPSSTPRSVGLDLSASEGVLDNNRTQDNASMEGLTGEDAIHADPNDISYEDLVTVEKTLDLLDPEGKLPDSSNREYIAGDADVHDNGYDNDDDPSGESRSGDSLPLPDQSSPLTEENPPSGSGSPCDQDGHLPNGDDTPESFVTLQTGPSANQEGDMPSQGGPRMKQDSDTPTNIEMIVEPGSSSPSRASGNGTAASFSSSDAGTSGGRDEIQPTAVKRNTETNDRNSEVNIRQPQQMATTQEYDNEL